MAKSLLKSMQNGCTTTREHVINKAVSDEEVESVLLCKMSVSLPSGSCKLAVLPLDASWTSVLARRCGRSWRGLISSDLIAVWASCAPMIAYLREANLLVLYIYI